MNTIRFSNQAATDFINQDKLKKYKQQAQDALKLLLSKQGKGNEFLGWIDLPLDIEKQLDSIVNSAEKLSKNTDAVVVIGIGGSYLGARSVIEALSPYFEKDVDIPELIYAGHHLSETYMSELLSYLQNKKFGIIVISKSGTTTEPAIAFRFLKKLLEEKVGKANAKDLIVAITDEEKGALKQLSDQEGYETFVIPDDVGGRYSVLTPVGLLPIALAGFDIKEMVNGAIAMRKDCIDNSPEENMVVEYAAVRNLFYNDGLHVEILANYEPRLSYIAEWWKQLYGESEGKENKGIFPASVNLTTDLHSLGQYIQEGKRFIFETVLTVENGQADLKIEEEPKNLDKLNYLVGKNVDFVNKSAEEGTRQAHVSGGVPNLTITLSEINENTIGQLLYFYELACGVSGYMLDVNPFDQPGVEAYKKNMFRLLGKPGV